MGAAGGIEQGAVGPASSSVVEKPPPPPGPDPRPTLCRRASYKVSGRYHQLPKKIEDDYEVDMSKVLGTGMNGSVYRAKRIGLSGQGDTDVAVKGFHLTGLSKKDREELAVEAEIFLQMDHPHVARLLAVYETSAMLHLIMECMEGGELFDRIAEKKRFEERDAAHSVWQMLLAIHYLHNQGIVHRDLKLENFLYETKKNDHLKLIDFGFSKVWEPNTKMKLSCGTLAYVAPEVLEKSYTSQCDMWSLGVVTFILVLGYMPFSGPEKEQMDKIRKGKYSRKPDKWKLLSANNVDFLEKLITVDASQRLTAEQALKHPWIADRDQSGRYHITPLARLDSNVSQDSEMHLNVDGSTIDALSSFAHASKFRRACMSLMAWSLSQEERAAVRDKFIELDVKRQGTIKLSELQEVLQKQFDGKDERIKPLLESLSMRRDFELSDEIHYSEFLAAMVSTRIAMHDEHLMATFRRFDADNSGYITRANLREVLGKEFSEEDMSELIQSVDPNNKDKISYPSFVEYLRSGNARESYSAAALKLIDQKAGGGTKTSTSLASDDDDGPSRVVTRKVIEVPPAATEPAATEPAAKGTEPAKEAPAPEPKQPPKVDAKSACCVMS